MQGAGSEDLQLYVSYTSRKYECSLFSLDVCEINTPCHSMKQYVKLSFLCMDVLRDKVLQLEHNHKQMQKSHTAVDRNDP